MVTVPVFGLPIKLKVIGVPGALYKGIFLTLAAKPSPFTTGFDAKFTQLPLKLPVRFHLSFTSKSAGIWLKTLSNTGEPQ